jgi:transposase
MARRRMLVVQQATRTLLSLQSMVTRHTGQTVRGRGLEDWTLVELREAFPEPASQETAAALLELLCAQRRIQRALEKQVLARVKLCGAWERLLSLPGVGEILGVTIMLESGPIERFGSAGDYASYCRAVDSRRDSNGIKKGENNRKNGNKYLAWAFVEAANYAARFNARAQAWLARKTARTLRVVAVKALACKLSKAAYYVLRDNVVFSEQKMFG